MTKQSKTKLHKWVLIVIGIVTVPPLAFGILIFLFAIVVTLAIVMFNIWETIWGYTITPLMDYTEPLLSPFLSNEML